MFSFFIRATRALLFASFLIATLSCNQGFKTSPDADYKGPVDISQPNEEDDPEDTLPDDDVPENENLVAVITGAPTTPSAITDLNVFISGTDITYYKFKVGATTSTDCGLAADYSVPIVVGVPITNSLTSIPDGSVTLCVIGFNSDAQQPLSSASSATWVQDLTP